jgi:hypothetical protein
MRFCMVQGISHAGKGLAAAGRHGERVNALRVFCPFSALFRNSPADCIHAVIPGREGLGFQPLNGGLPVRRPGTAQRDRAGEIRTADPVGSSRASGDHAQPELAELRRCSLIFIAGAIQGQKTNADAWQSRRRERGHPYCLAKGIKGAAL